MYKLQKKYAFIHSLSPDHLEASSIGIFELEKGELLIITQDVNAFDIADCLFCNFPSYVESYKTFIGTEK